MRRLWTVLVTVALAIWVTRAGAQYMYVDTNGDALHDSNDRLNADSNTTLELWIDTAHNRDGSASECSSGGGPLTISSYEFILHCEGGTVAWAAYTNLRPEMPVSFGLASDPIDYHNGNGGGTANSPGLYHLGTLLVSITSGNPSIAIVSSTPLRASFSTSFGSQCTGSDLDYTLKMGVDWSDADGVGAPDLPPSVSAPAYVSGVEGTTIQIDVTDGNYINWPNYSSYFYSGTATPATFSAAHEYTHAVQRIIYGYPPVCTEEAGDCLLDDVFGTNFCYNCATHYLCSGPQSSQGSWNEGMADAFGEMFYRAVYNLSAGTGDYPCSPTGPEKEGSVEAFVVAVASRDSRAFMETFRYATFTLTGNSNPDHARTVGYFHKLWKDENPGAATIVTHHSGTWNIDALYYNYIYGSTSGASAEDIAASGTPSVRAYPSPASGTLVIEAGGVSFPVK
jgi:hypothetical protein